MVILRGNLGVGITFNFRDIHLFLVCSKLDFSTGFATVPIQYCSCFLRQFFEKKIAIKTFSESLQGTIFQKETTLFVSKYILLGKKQNINCRNTKIADQYMNILMVFDKRVPPTEKPFFEQNNVSVQKAVYFNFFRRKKNIFDWPAFTPDSNRKKTPGFH